MNVKGYPKRQLDPSEYTGLLVEPPPVTIVEKLLGRSVFEQSETNALAPAPTEDAAGRVETVKVVE